MKLTNISLAILVALGLAACGGSDDNTPQTSDNQEAGHHNTGGDDGNKGGDDKKKNDEEIKKNDDNIDPTRKAADLTVKPALVDAVKVDKQVLISNQFGEHALGYDNGKYQKDKSTKPGDVKFTTDYNFLEEGDVFTTNDPASGMNQGKQVGAIYPSKKPDNGPDQNAFVKGKSGKYYRVRASQSDFKKYTPDTTYQLLNPFFDAGNAALLDKQLEDIGSKTGKGIPQSKVVFLANATIDPTKKTVAQLIADPATETNMDASLGQVLLTKVSVLGNSYNPGDINQSLDLNAIPVDDTKITTVPVVGDLLIVNNKRDADLNDRTISREVEIGHLKAYNLGYSIAYVGLDSSKENSKNIFNLNSASIQIGSGQGRVDDTFVPGQYQVSGYKTLALPKDGRAVYKGKSFSESTEGDVKLVAEFFEDRASVKGLVNNRKDILNDKKLPNLTLQPIDLTTPATHYTGGTGKVTGDVAHITDWSVQFYGLEAEEAGGYLKGNNYEVYTTKRKELSNQSNTADVK